MVVMVVVLVGVGKDDLKVQSAIHDIVYWENWDVKSHKKDLGLHQAGGSGGWGWGNS